MTRRATDPYASYNYLLEIGQIARAGFNEVTGINQEINIIEHREGNYPTNTPTKQPGLAKFGNITLKYGFSADHEFLELLNTIADGEIEREASMAIVLLNEKREEVSRWTLVQAWPVKWSGPDLKANASEIAIESVEFCHEGIAGTA